MATDDDTMDDGNAGAAASALVVGGNPRTPRQEGQLDLPSPQDDKATQLAQLRELKAKLDEDRDRLN